MVALVAWQPTAIEGVLRRRIESIVDSRGSFSELWRASLTAGLDEAPFVQANLSRSRAGVLRGMHFHRRQSDLWLLIEGRALAATTDLRSERITSQVVELVPGDALFIPRLVAHGFWALDDTALEYLVTNEYDGTDEHGFAWNDPLAAVAWPAGEPILSQRDAANPPLSEVVALVLADRRQVIG